jgi:hypothetical protein
MPVFDDLMKKHKGPLPKKDGTLPGPVKAPEVVPVTTMRVRMLRTVQASPAHGRNEPMFAGRAYELPVNKAREWIAVGIAEQDKAFDCAPETK